MTDNIIISALIIYMYLFGSFVTWFIMSRTGSSKSSERYWRNILSQDIKNAIDNGSEINAQGAYIIVKNGLKNDRI